MPFLPEAFNWFENLTALRDWWGLITLVLTFGLSFAVFFMFRHFNRLGSIIARVVLLCVFTYRVFFVFQIITETGNPLDALPWQISQLCSVLLPIAVLCNLPRTFKMQISMLSFFAGAVMLIRFAVFPDSFAEASATAMVDALATNSFLVLIPLLLHVTDETRFVLKRDAPINYLGLGALIGWGYLVNLVLYPGRNIMALEHSFLTFTISGITVLDYLIFLVPLLIAMQILLHFFGKRHIAYREKRNARLAREKVLVQQDRKAKRAKKAAARTQKKEERRKEIIEESDWE